jgi:hypothetical protein
MKVMDTSFGIHWRIRRALRAFKIGVRLFWAHLVCPGIPSLGEDSPGVLDIWESLCWEWNVLFSLVCVLA